MASRFGYKLEKGKLLMEELIHRRVDGIVLQD
jgi:hypothetical protein